MTATHYSVILPHSVHSIVLVSRISGSTQITRSRKIPQYLKKGGLAIRKILHAVGLICVRLKAHLSWMHVSPWALFRVCLGSLDTHIRCICNMSMKTKYLNLKNLISIHHVGCFAVEFYEENKNKIVSRQALPSTLRKSRSANKELFGRSLTCSRVQFAFDPWKW